MLVRPVHVLSVSLKEKPGEEVGGKGLQKTQWTASVHLDLVLMEDGSSPVTADPGAVGR